MLESLKYIIKSFCVYAVMTISFTIIKVLRDIKNENKVHVH